MSFLNGSSSDPTLAPSAQTQQSVLPDWYTSYAMQVLANQGAVSSRPYETYDGARVADFNPDQQRAFELTRQVARPGGLQGVEGMIHSAAGLSGAGAAQPYLGEAAGMSGVDAASGALGQGGALYDRSTDPTGISLATPFLGSAGQKSVSDVGEYMDPYTDAVVDRIGDLGARNLTEKFLPGLTDRFVSSGQFGGAGDAPSRFGVELGRGVRDIADDTLAQQNAALQAGYQGALGASAADKARQAQLAGTAGQLGTDQQSALARAGAGITDIGKTQGALTADQQRILTGIGSTAGDLTGRDAQTQLQAAQQMAAVQQQRQDMGIKGAGALEAVGAEQQGLQQKSLDTAYSDFLRQQGYDQTQIDAMTKTLQGVQPAVPKGVLTQGYEPVAAQPKNPSTLQTIAGVAANVLPFVL